MGSTILIIETFVEVRICSDLNKVISPTIVEITTMPNIYIHAFESKFKCNSLLISPMKITPNAANEVT